MSPTTQTQLLAKQNNLEFKEQHNGRVRLSDGETILIYYPESLDRTAMIMSGATYRNCTPDQAIRILTNRILELELRRERGELIFR